MMRPTVLSAAAGSYGALELKHHYRKNMMLGVILAATAHLAIVGGILIWQSGVTVPLETVPPDITLDDLSKLAPPPSMVKEMPKFSLGGRDASPAVGYIPEPVKDEDVLQEVHILTSDELAVLSAETATGITIGEGAQVIVNTPPAEILPGPDEFVAFQEKPVPIHFEIPVYPEIAELTGQSGTVWIRALVDKDGRVRDALIDRPSGSRVGFEEAALAAAFKNVYRPAIQNGQPVAVWITFKVEFKLK